MVKNYAKFEEVGIRQIKPEGWLGDFLRKQAEGLTGHLEVAGYPFDRVGWDRFDVDTTKSNDNPGWWAYEQTGYWLDGMERLAELLGDRKLKAKAERSFDYVLQNADPDGYLGPKLLKNSDGWNRWPHVVFFRAVMAKYSATGDLSLVEAVRRHYLEEPQRHNKARDVLNVEIMLWAYLKTGDKRLLDMAEKDFAEYNEQCKDDNCVKAQLSPKKAYAHGVTYNEYSKLGAILYSCTGKKEYLKPVIKAYKKIDRYQMLPDGLHCSNEFLLDNDYMQSHETCDVTDYTWAMGYLLMATGKAEYADKIEKCIFNAGIGAVEENFKALQYLSCANQLILDRTSNHADFLQGDKWMSYRPNPGTECCAGNVNRFFPNYCARMWMKKGKTIVAALYGASTVTYGTRSAKVTIKEDTAYPFEDQIRFSFSLNGERKLKFCLRLPGWCKNPTLLVNGAPAEYTVKDGFATIQRVFRNGDLVSLDLPSELEVKDWGPDGRFVEKGPLLYTYGMKGDRQIDEKEERQTKEFPAYNIYPDKPFNYAILPEKGLSFRKTRMGENPWSIEGTPYSISVKARRIPSWRTVTRTAIHPVYNLYTRPWKREEKKGKFVFTPRYPSAKTIAKNGVGEIENITLVPYAVAKVRVTVFPKLDKIEK